MTTTHRDGTRPNPPLLGSLAYLVLNLPIGIGAFVFVVTTLSLGIGTAIIWVGVAVLALAVLAMRGLATLERLMASVGGQVGFLEGIGLSGILGGKAGFSPKTLLVPLLFIVL